MASLNKDPNGLPRIQFKVSGCQRQTLRLGDVTPKQARTALVLVEQLVSAKETGIMEPDAARWIADMPDEMYGRLVDVGLVPPRGRVRATLDSLLKGFFEKAAVKASTLTTYKQTEQSLREFFKDECPINAITSDEAERWRKSMVDAKYAAATVSKRVKTARSIFRAGQQMRMVKENPFAGVKAGSQTNRTRLRFISQADIEKVLAACPDNEWRLIIAGSRYGGLRCPSEHLALRWGDIDWERECVTVTSMKTEGYEGRETRQIPLFPELKPYLRVAFENAEPGTEWVISRYRDSNANLRTQFERIIKRAGVKPWPKLFQNLRSTRQTELCDRYPTHVVCEWLGNTKSVAREHYLQVTDEHFARAVREGAGGLTQKATQQPPETDCDDQKPQTPVPSKTRETQPVSVGCVSSLDDQVTPMGFEPMSLP
jgi:integrase